VNEADFLEYHNGGLGKLLGISFLAATKDEVRAELPVGATHMTADDVVHGGVIMALADCTGAYGAVLNMPAGCTTATIESKTNFLRRGRGGLVRAAASPLHVGRKLSVWRTRVSRGDAVIAEVTQTQIYIEARDKARSPDRSAAPATASADRTVSAAPVAGAAPARATRGTVADDRRRHIFEAACQVLAKKGFANASIREVAAASGMPVPTMYQYIQSKEDLLLLIYQHFMRDVGRSMQAAITAGAPAHENLEQLVRTMLEVYNANQKYIRLMFQETKSLPPEMRRIVFDIDGQNIAIVRNLLAECREAGVAEFDNDEIAANLVYFVCTIWALRHWTLGKHRRAAVDQAVLDFIERGLAVRQGGARRAEAARRNGRSAPTRRRHG